MVTQEAQLGVQALHLFEQVEHGFKQGQIGAMHGPHVLDSPNGMVERYAAAPLAGL